MPDILAGAVSGLAATAPMTIAMETLFAELPLHQRQPLPPRGITMRLAQGMGIKHELNEPQRKALTLASHFSYGAAMGGLYASTVQPHLPGPLGGAAFGLGVWAANYLGLLPATNLYPHAAHSARERNLLMIAAHVIWGASLGALMDRRSVSSEATRRSEAAQAARV
jgi:putative membrane protein